MYLAYDGDKVGRKLEDLIIDNNEHKIEAFAAKMSWTLRNLEKLLADHHCRIIFASGDSVLARTTLDFDTDKVKRDYGDITFSLGIGKTPLEAMLALKKAKSKGIAKSCFYCLNEDKR